MRPDYPVNKLNCGQMSDRPEMGVASLEINPRLQVPEASNAE